MSQMMWYFEQLDEAQRVTTAKWHAPSGASYSYEVQFAVVKARSYVDDVPVEEPRPALAPAFSPVGIL